MPGGLRIIGGDLGGRRLEAPPGATTRPLPDRIRQSIFDMLGQRLDGYVVADIFAGSGSFGFEALSRGAAQAHAVERDRVAIGCLQRNAEALGVGKRHRVHAIDASAGLDPLPACDVLFCDPPFPWFVSERDLLSKVIDGAGRHLATEGCLLLRGERGHSPPPWPDFLQEESRRNYGRSWVAVLTLAADS